MNIGLYQSAASLTAIERWQDVVSQNITSAQNTAYRKRTVEFSTQASGEWQIDPRGHIGRGGGLPAVFPQMRGGINFAPGEMLPTRRNLDVAIQGEGFFEVQMADGSHAYTRSGEFRLRLDRTLITSADQEVLSDDGSPIVTLPGGGSITINHDGTLLQGTTKLGRLAVQNFADLAALAPLAGGMFRPGAGAGAPTPVEKPELLQGYLEGSNVAPLREMVDLVLISRAYEANQKIITTIDEQMQKTLDALG